MAKKKSPFDMGEYMPTKQEDESRLWCLKNDILISPVAKSEGAWWIEIKNKGKANLSPDTYIKGVVWEKMYEFYSYYYNKFNK